MPCASFELIADNQNKCKWLLAFPENMCLKISSHLSYGEAGCMSTKTKQQPMFKITTDITLLDGVHWEYR